MLKLFIGGPAHLRVLDIAKPEFNIPFVIPNIELSRYLATGRWEDGWDGDKSVAPPYHYYLRKFVLQGSTVGLTAYVLSGYDPDKALLIAEEVLGRTGLFGV